MVWEQAHQVRSLFGYVCWLYSLFMSICYNFVYVYCAFICASSISHLHKVEFLEYSSYEQLQLGAWAVVTSILWQIMAPFAQRIVSGTIMARELQHTSWHQSGTVNCRISLSRCGPQVGNHRTISMISKRHVACLRTFLSSRRRCRLH